MPVLAGVSAPLIHWPCAHVSEMPPEWWRKALPLDSILSFSVHDFPMLQMELWLVSRFSWTEILEAVSLLLSLLSFIISFLVMWIAYLWKRNKVLQIRYGAAALSTSAIPAAQCAQRSSSRAYQILGRGTGEGLPRIFPVNACALPLD
ncbi:hypothetical protein LSCM1_04587 [Leishmania martiniquensis]|uniref:Uncharacterized protein n=1 Tax=Leishmania martiniquensis TaxID=1580590 RepID=A0A836KM13_9TRYP|nr:hypothetical protein LSCM1_04587 [Leishmania martiniquensis]